MHPFAKAALGAITAAYANHVLLKPAQVAALARSYADRARKPMLTFVAPPGTTLKSFVRRSLAVGDVNLHPAGLSRSAGPGQIGRGSPYQIPVRPRSFACVFSCDTLEHLDRPDLALLEWHRVADKVFLVVPPWWTPEAWLSQWYIDSDIRRAWPVWAKQNRVVWLPDRQVRAYDAGTCPTPFRPAPSRPQRPAAVPAGPASNASAAPVPVPPAEPSPTSSTSSQVQSQSLPVVNLLPSPDSDSEDYRTEEELPTSPSEEPYLPPVVGSPSSSSVSSMMIMSGSDPESD